MVYRDPQTSLRNKVVRIPSADGLTATTSRISSSPKPGQGLARAVAPDPAVLVRAGRQALRLRRRRPRPGQRPGRPHLQRQGAAAQPGRQRPDRQPQVRPGQPDRADLLPVHQGPAQRLRHGLAPGRRPALPDRERPERRPARQGRRPAATTAGTAPTRACATNAALHLARAALVAGRPDLRRGRRPPPPWPPDKQGKLLVASAGLVYAGGPQRAGKAIQEFALDAEWRR